jgi:hypothetical protein
MTAVYINRPDLSEYEEPVVLSANQCYESTPDLPWRWRCKQCGRFAKHTTWSWRLPKPFREDGSLTSAGWYGPMVVAIHGLCKKCGNVEIEGADYGF